MIYRLFRPETLASVIASFMMKAVELRGLFSAGESIFSAKQETPDMIAAWTAASDFSERKRKIDRKQEEIDFKIEGYEDVIFTKERELKNQIKANQKEGRHHLDKIRIKDYSCQQLLITIIRAWLC